ncbi:MAG TPA: S1 family peptidase [Polyangiaceae bacterium]|nr:S1 family peptidase [Polyangiaceae bacterium]
MSAAGAGQRLLLLSGLLTLGSSACGGESTATTQAAIFGGAPAPDDTAVVAVVNFAGGQCSGSVIAPRLVLTARHCVADTATEDTRVVCGETDFTDPDSAGAVFVVHGPEITDDPDDYRALSAILIPEGVDQDLCGTDVVLLVLEQPLPDVTPLEPRLDQPVMAGEPYSAVGYGVDRAEQDNPSGVRKRLDDLMVKCFGDECDEGDVRDNEWVGSGGPCSGDSGGPALDAKGRVIGVVSRGQDPCVEPVFGDVATRAAWLRSEAIRLANAADQAPPTWAPCADPDPCTYDDEPESDEEELESSCAAVRGGYGGWPSGLLALGLAVARALRARGGRRNLVA